MVQKLYAVIRSISFHEFFFGFFCVRFGVLVGSFRSFPSILLIMAHIDTGDRALMDAIADVRNEHSDTNWYFSIFFISRFFP